VIIEMAKKNTAIHNFMLNVVCNGDMDKFKSKIKKFIVMASRYNIGQVTANTIKKVEKLMDMQILEPQQVQVSNESTEIEPISVTSTEPQTYWYTNEFNRFTAQFNDGSTYNMNSGEITNTDGILRYVESCGTTIEYSNNGMLEEVPTRYIDEIATNMLQEVNVNGENPSGLEELNELIPCRLDIDLMSDIRRTTLLGVEQSGTHHSNVMNLARANGYSIVRLNNQRYSSTDDAHEAMDSIEITERNADGELINMNDYNPRIMNKFLKLFMIMYATSKISNTYLVRNDFEFTFDRGLYYASYRTADDGTFMCAFGRRWDGCRFKFIYNENVNSLNILR
jgi:hypothetical protein